MLVSVWMSVVLSMSNSRLSLLMVPNEKGPGTKLKKSSTTEIGQRCLP